MKYFEGYSNLSYISANEYKPYKNLTAIICCRVYRNHCKFIVGINGEKCPDKCICAYYWNPSIFDIICSRTKIPPLPIPIIGNTSLNFCGNDLEELPKNTLSGYNDIQIQLKIGKNFYQPVDDNLILTLSDGKDLKQTANPFIYCDDNITMEFQHNMSLQAIMARSAQLLHNNLNAQCPDGCSCCFNRSTDYFAINCTHSDMQFYPDLPHSIPYNATLHLDKNRIASIKPSLGHASLRKLYLFENQIVDFPFHLIPKNITHLDLRKNKLETLDDQVVDFFRDREGSTKRKIELSGNPWTCDCRAKSFLSFLRQKEPLEYIAALDRCNIFPSGTCPEECICCLDNSTVPSMIIDCKSKGLKAIPLLPTLISGESTLHFEGNFLESLPSNSLPGYAKLAHLYLANNRLTEIDQLPENIITLDIRNNSISVLNKQMRDFFDKRLAANSQLKLQLSGNPWTCTCEEKDFLFFVRSSKYIENLNDIYCGGTGKVLNLMDESDLCPSGLVHYVTVAISFMIIISTINLIVYFKQPLLIWFYEHNVCMSLAAQREFEKQKKFDAFLSFTHKDEELIEEFVERLENGAYKFRLCFYLRDWLVGVPIPECISQSVKDSKRVIILMTNHFLKSTWGRLEFRLALHATSQDRCKRLIVVLYPEVENFDDLDSELRSYMVLNTYLKRDDPNFWNKLVYSMPHVNVQQEPAPEAIELSVINPF
ncbi:protein toll-like isoform X2 [Drosophila pseudoobscura]|uniref:Protein toll-like isoform X2 n=2 Tax=Drosophila pseudoobscura pseudoobscura TaxID=46245 RepID=A0A6I8VWM5_DROPS|nr:protein toll isoform X2 [Drosophila pseudoobscura]